DGELHRVAAIVVGANLDIRRQDLLVELVGLLLNALKHVLGLLAAAHHDNAFNRIVRLVETEFTETRRIPDRHLSDIAYASRHAILRAHYYVADIARVANQSQTAHVIELAALRIEATARVRIVDGELLHHHGYGNVVRI